VDIVVPSSQLFIYIRIGEKGDSGIGNGLLSFGGAKQGREVKVHVSI
jgi:hypothetical protein